MQHLTSVWRLASQFATVFDFPPLFHIPPCIIIIVLPATCMAQYVDASVQTKVTELDSDVDTCLGQ